MIYGNAHAFMEARLSDVENLNNKLVRDLKTHETKLQQMASNVTRLEKDKMICSMRLEAGRRDLIALNSTLALKDAKINSLNAVTTRLSQTAAPKCDICNGGIEKLNHSCLVDKLLAQNAKERLLSELRTQKESCNITVNVVRNKLSQAENERENCLRETKTLRNEKTDLMTQMDIFKGSCTTIENKFKAELETMKLNFESLIRFSLPDTGGLNYQTNHQIESVRQACRPVSDQITIKIDQALVRLRQDTISAMQDNSHLRVSNQRANDELKKCGQEKDDITQSKAEELAKLQKNSQNLILTANQENQRMKMEKDEVERILKESQNSMSRTSLQLVSLMENFQTCQKNLLTSAPGLVAKPNLEARKPGVPGV